MGCAVISNNVSFDCPSDTALAGLKNLYVIPVSDIDAVTFGVGALEHTITAITTTGAAFVKIESRFETRDFTSEMNRENYNTKTEKTINAFIPGMEKATLGAINELATSSKLLVIAELSNVGSTGAPKGIVAGWDKNLGKDGGLLLAAGSTSETDISGLIGTPVILTGVGTEIVRRMEGLITLADASTVTFA